MRIEYRLKPLVKLIVTLTVGTTVAVACESSSSTGKRPVTGGNELTGSTLPASGVEAISGGSGQATAGTVITGYNNGQTSPENSAVTSGSAAPVAGPTKCEVASKPVCAGLSGCELTNCYRVSTDELPATCSCLSGESLIKCCEEVKREMADCLDLSGYPECNIAPTCPMNIIEQLKTNPFPGAEQISTECENCLCANCMTQLNYVNTHGQPATEVMQCAIANHIIRDCIVCNPPPCDAPPNGVGMKMMTGPCSQEALNACTNCACGGPMDPNCYSLAGCLDEKTSSSMPCSAAHSVLECMKANCPACPSIPDCPSTLIQ